MKAVESSGDQEGMETRREKEDGDFRGNKVQQEGKQETNEVPIELKRSPFLEVQSCKKYCMGLIYWVITKDARSYPMPNGKKPKHHVTMTATTSLWRIFSVINATTINKTVYWWWQKNVGSVVKVQQRLCLDISHVTKFKIRHIFGNNKRILQPNTKQQSSSSLSAPFDRLCSDSVLPWLVFLSKACVTYYAVFLETNKS